MDSVYKLSKYSQKIDEACRAKQLNKVMEYNKHELTYINKLSKYFGNQKGGSTVQDVVGAVEEVLGDVARVVEGKEAYISRLKLQEEQYKKALGEKIISISNLEEELKHFKEQLKNADENRAESLKATQKVQDELNKSRESHQETIIQNNNLKEKLKSRGETQGKLEKIERELVTTQQARETIQQEKQQLEFELQTLRGQFTTTQEELTKAQREIKQAQEETQQVQEKHNRLEIITGELESTKDRLIAAHENDLRLREGELQTLSEDRDAVRKELAKAQEKVSKLSEELAKARQAQTEAQKIKEALEEIVKELQTQAQNAQRAQGAQGGSKRKK
jgi:chromosome segregation ATPase